MPTPYFKTDGFTLYWGNCLRILNQFSEESADMIFADPPYFLSNDGFTVYGGKKVSVNKGKWDRSHGTLYDFKFHNDWITLCKRILKKDGSIWISGTYHSIYQCGYALQNLGFTILNEIVWYKPNASPNLSGRYFAASHETLIWAKKGRDSKHTFNYNYLKNGEYPNDFLKKPGLQMRSVWVISIPKKKEKRSGKHPTQKPIELLRRVILGSTKEQDIILDPFCGSSTSGIVAHQFGRRFIGIDVEKNYLNLSVDRFQNLKRQTP